MEPAFVARTWRISGKSLPIRELACFVHLTGYLLRGFVAVRAGNPRCWCKWDWAFRDYSCNFRGGRWCFWIYDAPTTFVHGDVTGMKARNNCRSTVVRKNNCQHVMCEQWNLVYNFFQDSSTSSFLSSSRVRTTRMKKIMLTKYYYIREKLISIGYIHINYIYFNRNALV